MVGSGKMGFSIKPERRYQPFSDASDIDIVIVSPTLFELVWKTVFEYWRSKPYWPEEARFKQYFFQGWIRPDKLPPARTFSFCKDWWEFFRHLTNSGDFGDYKIAAGLYQSWFFLESYQSISIEKCREIE